MKSLVFLCLLFVTFCAAQRVPNNVLDQAFTAIKNAKNSVDTVMLDLRHSRTNINLKAQSEITNYYIAATSRINEVLNTRLNYIKEKSQEAKESGKDADDCLNIVTKDMKAAAQTGYSEVKSCEQEANKKLGTILQTFDNEQANGQKLKNQLDQIALECMNSSNPQQMANCIFLKIAIINQDIRQYQQRASQLTNQANSQKNALLLEQFSCNAKANDKIQSASTKAIYAAVDCLKN
ncbi:uncharacterized protein LOC122538477 [Frieseomelitta varia]|uniref:uncharacterized protein LOC122538477 n=1 Tax=Frieseomelitta varia TaxID=561572 RepID=UPI001CB6A1C9|nr:uncharacterized protein LOC122538477 [Frieseomelitta varia]